MNMTYLHHSGFQIETKQSVLLFDYYTQNGMFDRVNEGDFPHKKFYIFVTHGHGDHYDPAIGHIISCPMMWNCPRISKGK